jgi:hypothetical protein
MRDTRNTYGELVYCDECGRRFKHDEEFVFNEISQDTFFEWSVPLKGDPALFVLFYEFFPNAPEPEVRTYEAGNVAEELGIWEGEALQRARERGIRLAEGGENSSNGCQITVGGVQIEPVSLEELGVKADQGTASRMTIRNMDRTLLEVVKARFGADSDAAAVRMALEVAGEVLLTD